MPTHKEYKAALKDANTLQDVFNITTKFYNTEAKLGTITKNILILKIDTLIAASGVKLKT